MSATVAGAYKQLIESAGLGLSAYRDVAPPGAQLPFAVIQEGIGRANDHGGDFGSSSPTAAPPTVREQVQVDLYQAKRRPGDGRNVEQYSLPDRLHRALHGGLLTGLDARTWPVVVRDSRRLAAKEPKAGEAGSNLVRDVFTTEFVREVTP